MRIDDWLLSVRDVIQQLLDVVGVAQTEAVYAWGQATGMLAELESTLKVTQLVQSV